MEEYLKELRYTTAPVAIGEMIEALKKVTWNAAVHHSVRRVAEKALKDLGF